MRGNADPRVMCSERKTPLQDFKLKEVMSQGPQAARKMGKTEKLSPPLKFT